MTALTQEEINALPPEERLEALDEKVAEIQEERPDLADIVGETKEETEEPETFRQKIGAIKENAKVYGKLFLLGVKIGLFLVAFYFVQWVVTLDRLPKEYHQARAAKEKAIQIAEIQYRIDVANVDLKKLTTKK